MPWLNPWLILGVVLAVLGAAAGGYWKGYGDADRSAEVTSLKATQKRLETEAAELRRQADAAQDIARSAAERQRAAEAQQADMQAEIDDYVRLLDKEPAADACRLSPADVERLRHIGSPAPGRPAPGPARGPIKLFTRPAAPAAGR